MYHIYTLFEMTWLFDIELFLPDALLYTKEPLYDMFCYKDIYMYIDNFDQILK